MIDWHAITHPSAHPAKWAEAAAAYGRAGRAA